MATTDSNRLTELIEQLRQAGRRQSRATVLFHHTVAEALGLHSTDHKCLDILCERGPMSAGELAEAIGLSSGAMTGVVDRLERAGFVQRDADPGDRRRVILRVQGGSAEEKIGPLFKSLSNSWAELCSRYNVDELEFILDFMRETSELIERETARLRQTSSAPPPADTASRLA